MKRFIFVFIFFGLFNALSAQTIESVMRALQERHMAIELKKYSDNKLSHYSINSGTFASHTPYALIPISWGGGLGDYPSDGSLASLSVEQRMVVYDKIRLGYNRIRGSFVALDNSPGWPMGQRAARYCSFVSGDWAPPIDSNNLGEVIGLIGRNLNQFKNLLWKLQSKVVTYQDMIPEADEDSPASMSVNFAYNDPSAVIGSIVDLAYGGGIYTWPCFYSVYTDMFGFGGEDVLDGWRGEFVQFSNYNSGPAIGAEYYFVTGVELSPPAGDVIMMGGHLPLPQHVLAAYNLSSGTWPNGYDEFKGVREVGVLSVDSEVGVYDLRNSATGYVSGSINLVKKESGGSYGYALANDPAYEIGAWYPYAYERATIFAMRRFAFEHMVAEVSATQLPSAGAGDIVVDARRGAIYLDLGVGLDGLARGAVGLYVNDVLRGGEVVRDYMGVAQLYKWKMLAGVGRFEVYYNTNAQEMPVPGAAIMNSQFRLSDVPFSADDWWATIGGRGYVVFPGVQWYTNPRIAQIVGRDVIVNFVQHMSGAQVDRHRFRIDVYTSSQKAGFVNGSYGLSGNPIQSIEVRDLSESGGMFVAEFVGGRKSISVQYDAPVESYHDPFYPGVPEDDPMYFETLMMYDAFGGYTPFVVDPKSGENYRTLVGGGDIKKVEIAPVSGVVGPNVVSVYDPAQKTWTSSVGGVVLSTQKYPNGNFYQRGVQLFAPLADDLVKLMDDSATIMDSRYKSGFFPVSETGPGWFWQDFDSYGRVTKRIDQLDSTPFPESATPWPGVDNYTTENTYSDNTQTTVTKRAGQVTGRSWRVWNGLTQVTDYVATDLSESNYSAAGNLKTTTFYYGGNETTAGAEPWAVKAIVYPDQTASLYTYAFNTGTKQKTVTVSTGQPNAPNSPTSIVKGTETVTITNFQGYVLSSVTTDIVSNTILVSEVVPSGSVDDFGRPTRINFLDGTHVSRTYYPDFRGLIHTETDRNGVESTYTYDVLNRLATVDRDGVITTITPTGLTTTTTYSASSGGSHTEVSTVDLLGQLVSSSSTFEPSTSTAVTRESGKLIYTTTDATTNLTVIKKYYEDGSLESISGTGTKHYRYEYGAGTFSLGGDYQSKSLSFTKEILLADNGADSDTYVKTYTDGAGRAVVVEAPSATGSGTAYAYSYYNAKGQLWKTVDADGVIRILGYDEQGRQTTVAIDVNQNGTANAPFDSVDEVTTTTTTYADGKSTTVTQVGLGTSSREVSRSVTTISSGTSTVTTNGNTNLVTTITPNVAAKSVTVSGADGQATYIFDNNGQPASCTVKDSTNTTLKTASYEHDKFGRLKETSGDAAGASFTTTFNPDGTLASSTAAAPGLTSQSLTVTYSTVGTNRRMLLNTNGKTQTIEVSGRGDLVKRSGFATFDMDLTHERGTTGTTTTLTTAGGVATTFEANAAGVTTGKTFTGNNAGPSAGYSAGGRPLAVATPAGADATYGYGSIGVERGLVKTITYPPNSNTTDVAIDYDEQGRVKTITDASGSRTLTYEKDQLDTETYTDGPLNGLVIDRSFDTRDRRDGLILKKGDQTLYSVGYGYHGNTSDLENVTKNTWSSHYTYKAETKLIDKVIQKRNGTPVLTTTRNYDAFKRLESISSTAGANTTSYAYHYNAAGQRDTITRENQDYWDIGYQTDGQLHTAVKKNGAGVAYPGFNYAYDFSGIGSRSKTTTNDASDIDREAVYTPNDLNQVTSREVPGFVDVLGSIDALTEVTVDVGNTSSPVTQKGAWNVSTAGSGFHGTGYLQDGNAEKGKKWVDYSLVVTPGTYSVELIWVADAGNSSAVPVIVNAGNARKTRVVNQQANGGTWVSVGTYTMTTGGHLSVRIANMGTTGQVIADAVRIKRTSDTWEQVLDSESATLVTTLNVAKLGDIFYKAIPVDNSAGPVAVKIDITGLLAGAGENGADAVASFETSAIVPPADTALANDLDGRRKDDWKWTYTWNAAGQLRSVESTTAYVGVGGPQIKLVFDYDAQGRRFSKKVYRDGATTASETLYFIYDGWNLIAELSDTLAVVRSYTWGPDISQTYQGAGGIGGLLTIQTGPSTTYFPVYDGSGNITGLVNATTGTVDAVYEYAPFGEPVRVSGVAKSVSPFGFSTKYTDLETGFCYYGHRYYDPELGHWISREPLGEMESANLYAFCRNDPVNNVDYLGMNVYPQSRAYIDQHPEFSNEQRLAIIHLAESVESYGISFADLLAEANRRSYGPLPEVMIPRAEISAYIAPATGTARDAVAGGVAAIPKFGYDLGLGIIYSGNFFTAQVSLRDDFNLYAASRVSSAYVYPAIEFSSASLFGADSTSQRFHQGRVITEGSLQLAAIVAGAKGMLQGMAHSSGKLPHGFSSVGAFNDFVLSLKRGLRRAGLDDVQPILQGSAVTGRSFRTGIAFDVGRVSDFDVALISSKLLARAKGQGIPLRSGGARSAPLLPEHLQRLGLSDLAEQLSNQAGRPVNFMIYETTEAALSRAPSILFQQ
jgi:RHS repeat-associated protein